MAFLIVRALSKSYAVGDRRLPVLRELDLTVDEGEMVAVVGASGIGKSTLLHCVGGLDALDGGSVKVAAAHHPGPRRAGRRDVGRGARRRPQARRELDAPQLRPRAEPDLRRHVGHLAGPEVHARRRRPRAPVPQLDPRPRRRHRRDRLALPAPERPLGPRPPLRADAARHRGRARPRRGELDQPAAAAGRGPPGDDRRARQDRRRLHPRPRDRRIPLGHPDHRAERDHPHRRGHRGGHRERRGHVQRPRAGDASGVSRE